ncbi:MAG TPA: PaaI family thioesterase [Methylomirabilota bacterium]|nr:PaaI family thioesterase [Methylomirabilota bacterium]
MTTIDATLRHALEVSGHDLILTLDPALQGLPETAHGGSVLAVFDALAGVTAPRAVSGTYRRRVPLGLPLTLRRGRDDSVETFSLCDQSDAVLVDGRVALLAADAVDDALSRSGGGGGPLRGPVLSGLNRSDARTSNSREVASVVRAAAPRPLPTDVHDASAHPLPVSRACFACGKDNALGLRATLEFDADAVRAEWQPRPAFRRADGTLAPAALTTLLDEAAFWLGALATGESGMTTELRVSLHRPAPFDATLTVAGARAAVRPREDDARYQDTEIVARAGDQVVATARITFVVVRGAARRLVNGMLAINDPECVRRVFPAYTR